MELVELGVCECKVAQQLDLLREVGLLCHLALTLPKNFKKLPSLWRAQKAIAHRDGAEEWPKTRRTMSAAGKIFARGEKIQRAGGRFCARELRSDYILHAWLCERFCARG